jgi:hypothetical protein
VLSPSDNRIPPVPLSKLLFSFVGGSRILLLAEGGDDWRNSENWWASLGILRNYLKKKSDLEITTIS